MSLNKVSKTQESADVAKIVDTRPSLRRVAMTVDQSGMTHVIARLTDLYTNPIEASTRETVSNAIDATFRMPEAARRPVEVNLPSAMRPVFTVRDYGVGMTMEEAETIYSQYGVSTKVQNMDQTGAYGLGAKAPLAYCSEFTVSTTKDGWTTVFKLSRTDEGNFMDVVSHGETNLPSGTMVQIPAKASDLEAFRNAVDRYTKYSIDVPVVIDGTTTAAADLYYLLTDNFVLDADSGTTTSIYIRRDRVSEFITSRFRRDVVNNLFAYVLSGWDYRSIAADLTRNSWRASGNSQPLVFVQLKPGVVDFSSSRDEITQNHRSTSLDVRVEKFLKMDSDEGKASLMKLYSMLSLKDSLSVFYSALSLASGVNEKGELLIANNQSIVSTDLFTLPTGDKIFDIHTKAYSNTVDAVFKLTVDAQQMSFFAAPESFNPSYESLKRVEFSSSNVSRVKTMLHAAIARPTPQFSAAKIALNNAYRSYAKSRQQFSGNTYVIETPHTEAQRADFNRMLSLRKALAEGSYQNSVILLSRDVKATLAQLAEVEHITGIAAKAAKFSEFIEAGRAHRKANTVARVDPSTERIYFEKILGASCKTEEDLIKVWRGSSNHGTIAEIIASDAYVILKRADHRTAIVGALNKGMDLLNHDIYIFDSRAGLKAGHYKELLNYDKVISSEDFRPTSKVAQELFAKTKCVGYTLNSTIAQAKKSDLIVSYLMSNSSRSYFNSMSSNAFNLYLSYAKARADAPAGFYTVLDSMHEYRNNSGKFLRLSKEEFASAIDAELYQTIHAFGRGIEYLSELSSAKFDEAVIIQFMHSTTVKASAITNLVLEKLHNNILHGMAMEAEPTEKEA